MEGQDFKPLGPWPGSLGPAAIGGPEKPSVCRLVQYNDENYPPIAQDPDRPEPDNWIAAIIVCVHSDEVVNLVTWDPDGHQHCYSSVEFGTDRHQWRWPPRV